MRRAEDRTRTGSFTLAPGVHRPRRPQPCIDRTRLPTHPKQARYSTDYAQICGTNIMRGTPSGQGAAPAPACPGGTFSGRVRFYTDPGEPEILIRNAEVQLCQKRNLWG